MSRSVKKGPYVEERLIRRIEAMNEGVDGSFEAGMGLEANLFALCFATEDQKEGMKAFLEKRPAVFKGK